MSQDIENWGSPKEQCYLCYFHDWKLKVGSSLLLDSHIFSGPSQWWWGLGVGLVVDWFLSDLIFRCLFLVSVQVSRSVMSYSLRPHGLQHARPPCVSPTPGAYSNSCSSSWWCHPTISSSVIPFSSHLQSFPASGSFPMSQFFPTGGQIIGVSASISPSNEHSGLISFRIDWLDLLTVQGTLKSLLQHHSSKAWILWHSAFFIVQLSHPYMTTGPPWLDGPLLAK